MTALSGIMKSLSQIIQQVEFLELQFHVEVNGSSSLIGLMSKDEFDSAEDFYIRCGDQIRRWLDIEARAYSAYFESAFPSILVIKLFDPAPDAELAFSGVPECGDVRD